MSSALHLSPFFHLATRIYIEHKALEKIAEYCEGLGSHAVLLSIQRECPSTAQLEALEKRLEQAGISSINYDKIERQASSEELNSLVYFLKQCRADFIIAFGGRESLQAARTAAFLAANRIFAEDLASEKITQAQKPLPVIALPLGPAMGEELAPFCSVFYPDKAHVLYHSRRLCFPYIAVLDPSALTALSSTHIARAGLATLAMSVESLSSPKANDISILHSMRSIELVMRYLVRISQDVQDSQAARHLCLASAYAGMALAKCGPGLCYSLTSSICCVTGSDFYMMMSILLPHVMEYNLTEKAELYVHVAKSIGEDISKITVVEAAIKAIEAIRKLCLEFKVPRRLSDFQMQKGDLQEASRLAAQNDISYNNPRSVQQDSMEKLLLAAL